MKISLTNTALMSSCLALLLTLPASAFASNWMRSEDELYFKAGLDYDEASERWDRDGELTDISCTATNWSHNQSYEYGLSYYRTVFGTLEYFDRRCGDVTESRLGDLTVGMRGRLNIYRNGRTWETALVIPSEHSGLYGLRLGVFGSFGDIHTIGNEAGTSFELGANLYLWEGTAPEQLASYIKYNFAPSDERRFFTALEGDYALVDRDKVYDATINQVENFGYDRLNLRIGYSQKVSLDWRMSIEATGVLMGRNASKTNGVSLSFSRIFEL
jgi:hypothetical protein